MASKTLKGLTVKIGADTSDLYESLQKVEKQGRSLSSELGQINKLLRLDPTNTDLLAQKQKVLAEAISNTESKLTTLREAEKQVQAQFERGEVSQEHVRALRREIIETERKLDGYKKAAQDTTDAVEGLGKESKETAEEIEKKKKKVEEAEEALEELGDSATELAKNSLTALTAAAAAAVTAIVALAEESRVYRTEMGKLSTAFLDAGHTAEVAEKTYEELQSVLGETEQAVEAANHLAKLCDTEEELADWTEIATGVYATFGASLPIEGLTEAANETAKTGALTGALADALNWAGVSEDDFQASLDECSSEQERQQKITKTLTKLYKGAAIQYKTTNKEVIRANQATEKWNKATAKIGKTVEPVVTDIKELGVVLLEDASEPLEGIADFIRKEVIPAIRDVSNWVKQNGPLIKSTLVGITAAIVAFEVATIAATVAQKGLKGAIMATEIAQKALALAQSLTPWGVAAIAIAAVTAAVVAYNASIKEAEKPVDVLTSAERELIAAADEAAEAFRDQKKAADEALGNVTAEMKHTSELAEELLGLASASGRVQQSDQERANFIINELNEALGTEIEMVGGVISNYDELKASIDEVIQAKTANSLIEAANDAYVSAIQGEAQALEVLALKEKDLQQQKAITKAAYDESLEAWARYEEVLEVSGPKAAETFLYMASEAETNWLKERDILNEKQAAYDQSALDYGLYHDTIANYEEAQTAVLSGNYQKAVDLLAKKGKAFGQYSDKVDTETAKVLDTLYKEAIDAGLEAERTKRNFENGVDGYTKDMVTEAEKGYEDALDEFADAYADAESVGEDLGSGLSGGMENKRTSLYTKARSLVSGIISAMRKEADSNSPAKKTIDFGEDVGEGAEIGIENKTDDVKQAATNQAAAILDAYSTQEANAQRALRSISEQQATRQTAGQMTAATANSAVLGQILEAIQKGQVLTLDGDALVGGTADRFNNRLGQLHILTARGAK